MLWHTKKCLLFTSGHSNKTLSSEKWLVASQPPTREFNVHSQRWAFLLARYCSLTSLAWILAKGPMFLLPTPPMSAPTSTPNPVSSHLQKLHLCFGNEPLLAGLVPRGAQTGQGRELSHLGHTSYYRSIIYLPRSSNPFLHTVTEIINQWISCLHWLFTVV